MNLMRVKMRTFMQTFPWDGDVSWGLYFVVGVEGISEGHCLRQGTFPGKCLLSVLGLRQFPVVGLHRADHVGVLGTFGELAFCGGPWYESRVPRALSDTGT